MENVKLIIDPITECRNLLELLLRKIFELSDPLISDTLDKIDEFIRLIKPEMHICVEYPYVDKLYRDEYYHYYSSKLLDYPRNCIRISFFDRKIANEDFRDSGRYDFLQGSYKGFLVIRPTFPNVIGRSVISPAAFTNPEICCCVVKLGATVNGVKLTVEGFPHASQDSEMMVCAETTLWSMMEYFSHKYAEYKPVLPHQIHQLLSHQSWQRQVPSQGLTAVEISFATKQLGFGVKVYSQKSYGNEFENIIKSYVETGIPVIAAMKNSKGIGHVVNLVGRTAIPVDGISALPERYKLKSGQKIFDFFDLPFEYVMIDDNHAPYRVAPLDNPALHYAKSPQWNDCEITNIVVPLYHRIYMEADEAKRLAAATLNNMVPTQSDHWVVRVFLTSSRSFKNAVAYNETMDPVLKELLINLSMPKFVWVAELSDKGLLVRKLASGMILMDATQPQTRKEALLAYFDGNDYFNTTNQKIRNISIAFSPFSIYTSNLKTF